MAIVVSLLVFSLIGILTTGRATDGLAILATSILLGVIVTIVPDIKQFFELKQSDGFKKFSKRKLHPVDLAVLDTSDEAPVRLDVLGLTQSIGILGMRLWAKMVATIHVVFKKTTLQDIFSRILSILNGLARAILLLTLFNFILGKGTHWGYLTGSSFLLQELALGIKSMLYNRAPKRLLTTTSSTCQEIDRVEGDDSCDAPADCETDTVLAELISENEVLYEFCHSSHTTVSPMVSLTSGEDSAGFQSTNSNTGSTGAVGPMARTQAEDLQFIHPFGSLWQDLFAAISVCIEIAGLAIIEVFEKGCLGVKVFPVVSTLMSIASTTFALLECTKEREEGRIRIHPLIPIYSYRPTVVFSILRLAFCITGLVHRLKGQSEADFFIAFLSLSFAVLESGHGALARHFRTAPARAE